MSLQIHNTLTRRVEPFTPIEPGHVRMYVCGMTIYDLCHMGHARMMMAFDVVYRWLQVSGYRVTLSSTKLSFPLIQKRISQSFLLFCLSGEEEFTRRWVALANGCFLRLLYSNCSPRCRSRSILRHRKS